MYHILLLLLICCGAVSSEWSGEAHGDTRVHKINNYFKYLMTILNDDTEFKDNIDLTFEDVRNRLNYEGPKNNDIRRFLQWVKDIFHKPSAENTTADASVHETTTKNNPGNDINGNKETQNSNIRNEKGFLNINIKGTKKVNDVGNSTRAITAENTTAKVFNNTKNNTAVKANNKENNPTKAIDKLTAVLEKLNQNILILSMALENRIYSQKYSKFMRVKREINDGYINNTENKNNTSNLEVSILNLGNTTTVPTTTVSNSDNIAEVLNDTETTNETANNMCNTEDIDSINGRRMYNSKETSSEIKHKLLSYLDITFEEIISKISPITKIRQAFENDDVFRIGYIVANIDTLQRNIKNMKRDMEMNKSIWNDRQILNIFDKLIASNKVVTNLLETLRMYSKKHNAYPQE